MLDARPNYSSKLDFVEVQDFEQTGVFDEAVEDVDAVIHVASVRPFILLFFHPSYAERMKIGGDVK